MPTARGFAPTTHILRNQQDSLRITEWGEGDEASPLVRLPQGKPEEERGVGDDQPAAQCRLVAIRHAHHLHGHEWRPSHPAIRSDRDRVAKAVSPRGRRAP